MDSFSLLLRPAVLVAHLAVMALTLSAVLREAWSVLTTRRIDARRAAHTLRAALLGLSALLSTGLLQVALGAAPWLWPQWALSAYAVLVGALMALCVQLTLRASRTPPVSQQTH